MSTGGPRMNALIDALCDYYQHATNQCLRNSTRSIVMLRTLRSTKTPRTVNLDVVHCCDIDFEIGRILEIYHDCENGEYGSIDVALDYETNFVIGNIFETYSGYVIDSEISRILEFYHDCESGEDETIDIVHEREIDA